MAEKQVIAPFITAHKELERQYYKYRLISKEEFDLLHGQNWDTLGAELIAKGYRTIPEPEIDLVAKIAGLERRLLDLENK